MKSATTVVPNSSLREIVFLSELSIAEGSKYDNTSTLFQCVGKSSTNSLIRLRLIFVYSILFSITSYMSIKVHCCRLSFSLICSTVTPGLFGNINLNITMK